MVENLLGVALREHREQTVPPRGRAGRDGRRRTHGLRREELAGLSGVSADHLKRLEQGRRRPSPKVLNALAAAMELDHSAYEHLCELAGHSPTAGSVPRTLEPAAQRLLERLATTAVCVCDAAWTVIDGNEPWRALRCGASSGHLRDQNLAWRIFTGVPNRIRRSSPEELAFRRLLVSELRAASLRYPDDRDLAALVAELREASRVFDDLWRDGPVAERRGGRLVIDAPTVGALTLVLDVLDVREGDLRAVVFTPVPGSGDAARLQELVAPQG